MASHTKCGGVHSAHAYHICQFAGHYLSLQAYGIFCLNLSIIIYLGVKDSPQEFVIENLSINVEFLNNRTGEITAGAYLVSITEIVSDCQDRHWSSKSALKSERKKNVSLLKKYIYQGPEKKMQGAKERYYKDPKSRRQYWIGKYQGNPEQEKKYKNEENLEPKKEYEKNKYEENPELKREYETHKYDKNPEPKKENHKKIHKKNKKCLNKIEKFCQQIRQGPYINLHALVQ